MSYNIVIDFDYASKAWMANKKKIGEGSYIYICGCKTVKRTKCNNKPSISSKEGFCYIHAKKKGGFRNI